MWTSPEPFIVYALQRRRLPVPRTDPAEQWPKVVISTGKLGRRARPRDLLPEHARTLALAYYSHILNEMQQARSHPFSASNAMDIAGHTIKASSDT